jgi:hypothetical protein
MKHEMVVMVTIEQDIALDCSCGEWVIVGEDQSVTVTDLIEAENAHLTAVAIADAMTR